MEDAADAMVGLHSSDPATVYLSARARVDGMAVDDLRGYEDGGSWCVARRGAVRTAELEAALGPPA